MNAGERMSPASAVDGDRLWHRHIELAQIGATARGGVNRQALSPEDGKARAMLLDWAQARGFAGSVDPIGNLFIRRPGRDGAAAPVVTGSHLDTQPTGGKFDGSYGVLAGLEAIEAMSDLGLATRRPIDLVVWTNEEGSRFQPTTMGSAVFAGACSSSTRYRRPTQPAFRSEMPWLRHYLPLRSKAGDRSVSRSAPMSRPISSRGRFSRGRNTSSAW